MNPGEVAEARCAVHETSLASEVCARCGAFMCGTCVEEGGLGTCPSCRQRTGEGNIPFRRDDFELGELLIYGWELFRNQWVVISLSVILFYGVGFAINFVGQLAVMGLGFGMGTLGQRTDPEAALPAMMGIFGIVFLVQMVTYGILTMGLIAVALDTADGRTARIGRLFSQVRRIGHFLLMMFVVGPAMYLCLALTLSPFALFAGLSDGSSPELPGAMALGALGVVALVAIPVGWVGLGLVFPVFELVYDPSIGAFTALRRGFGLVRGHRLVTLGTVALIFPLSIVGMLVLCIGTMPALGFWYLLLAILFLTLRNGAGLPGVEARPEVGS